jgi:nitrate/nitrite transporter NarK
MMMLLAAVSIFAAAAAESGLWSGAFLALGLAARAVASPNLFAILQRIVPANVISAGTGLDNGIANLGSAITPALIGILIGATGNYAAGLYFLMAAALVAAVAMGMLSLRRY